MVGVFDLDLHVKKKKKKRRLIHTNDLQNIKNFYPFAVYLLCVVPPFTENYGKYVMFAENRIQVLSVSCHQNLQVALPYRSVLNAHF